MKKPAARRFLIDLHKSLQYLTEGINRWLSPETTQNATTTLYDKKNKAKTKEPAFL